MTDIKTAKFEKMIHSKVTPKPREGKKAPQSPPSDAEDATAGAHGCKAAGLQSLNQYGFVISKCLVHEKNDFNTTIQSSI